MFNCSDHSTQAASKVKLLNVVIDSLMLRLLQRVPKPSTYLKEKVSKWREYKDSFEYDSSKPCFVEFKGLGTFRLLPIGHKPYEFVFVNEQIGDIRLWNPDRWDKSRQTGQIFLDFRSSYLQDQNLWLPGVQNFIESCFDLFYDNDGFADVEEQSKSCSILVSRGDLAVDVQLDQDLRWYDLDRFIGRSRFRDSYIHAPHIAEQVAELQNLLKLYDSGSPPPKGNKGGANAIEVDETVEIPKRLLPAMKFLTEHYHQSSMLYRVCASKQPQTIYFGRFASEVYARIYNKLASLSVQNKNYMKDIWRSQGWDEKSPVWRVEFSLSGDFLKGAAASVDANGEKLDLRQFHNFLNHVPHLWKYLTENWLRHCDPSDDGHQHRWEVSQFWQVVQSAFNDDAYAIQRIKVSQPETDQLKAQAFGVILSWCAVNNKGVQAKIGAVKAAIDKFFMTREFWDRFQERCQLYGTDDFTDTAITAQYRSWRMAEGFGS